MIQSNTDPVSLHATLREEMRARADELLELHRRLVRIPSVNRGDGSSARESEVAGAAADYLSEHGVGSRVVESAPGRGNLLAEWEIPARGAGAKDSQSPTLLLMGHSDVVPAGDESRWRFPPFAAEVAEGRIWGRGTNDCKMLVAAELFTMGSLARLFGGGGEGHHSETRAGDNESRSSPPLSFPGRMRLAIGADEEAGGRFGFGWLAENEADFLRADLAVNEGGGAFVARGGNPEALWFNFGCGEKGRYEVIISAEGRGTHASIPWSARNPLAALATVVDRLARWHPPVSADGPTFGPLRALLGLPDGLTAENLEETIEAARGRSKAFANSLMAQSRPTIAPTILHSGEKSNAVPGAAELRCDARLLPGQSIELFEELLRETTGDLRGVEFRIETTAEASESPADSETVALFERALDLTFAGDGKAGACRALPNWCTGFTDSRFPRALGTPTYGFQVVEPNADPDRLGIHCIDESIEVGMLLPCALSLGHLALEFFARRAEAK